MLLIQRQEKPLKGFFIHAFDCIYSIESIYQQRYIPSIERPTAWCLPVQSGFYAAIPCGRWYGSCIPWFQAFCRVLLGPWKGWYNGPWMGRPFRLPCPVLSAISGCCVWAGAIVSVGSIHACFMLPWESLWRAIQSAITAGRICASRLRHLRRL